jgi:CelD/BcsL family acetyltransferase involved in cellulose biosynthesis
MKRNGDMPEPLEIHVLRCTHELHDIAPQWTLLWGADPQSTPFQSPEWLLPWWRQFGQPELRAVTISNRGGLIGLLPFYIYREPVSGQRQMLLVGAGTSDYLDGIFSPECTVLAVRAALETLTQTDGWDTLIASQLRPQSKLFRGLSALSGTQPFEAEYCGAMPALPVQQLPLKIRRNAMYYRNRAQRLGALDFMIADQSNWPMLFAELQQLHTECWQARGEPGVLADPRVLEWHRDAMPGLLASGILRLCALRLNGQTLGLLYSLLDAPTRHVRTQYFYLTAYSIKNAELRPGTLLLAFAIEHAAQEGIQRIDMLRGDEAYKRIWHLEPTPTFGFLLNRKSACSSAESGRAA